MAKEDDEKGADGADKTASGTKASEAKTGETAGQAAGGASSSNGKSASGQGSLGQGSSGQGSAMQGSSSQASGQGQDAIALLKADHRAVEKLFAEFQKADDDRKTEIVEEACDALVIHTMLEEEIFYPACREAVSDEDPLDEAQVEHDSVKLLIAELLQGPEDGEYRDAQFKVMSEQVKHHVAEEEKPGSGIFAKAQAAKIDLADLGRRIQARKQQLEARKAELRPSRPISFRQLSRGFGGGGAPGAYRSTEGDRTMPRYQERDERGRFTDDDDDRRYGGSSRSSSSSSGRGHGGWYGDSEGHSQAARSRGESRSYRDDDDDDRGYRSRGRDDDDRGSSSRDRSQGGWFGDSRGHSEAARRGWEERDGGRSSSRSYRDDDDDRGYRSRSRDDDDRGSSRDRGQGGWFGDSRGHAEAARRGWEERDGGRSSSRSYRDDDDDRGYRSRSRDDDNDDRGSSRGRGHGGWFGDSRGHAEAARRGWDDRR